MAEKERNVFIDLLRGISMGAVISLHALANYLHDPFILKLWDIQQFAVQMFVFCSAYLFFSRPPQLSFSTFIPYFIKRFWRLYQPYLVYMLFYFSAVFFLRPASFNWQTVFDAAALRGGIDISWLVLLFVQFILVFPLIQLLFEKQKLLFGAFVLIVVYSAVFFFFLPFPFHWKWIMWLTWSFMAIYALFYKTYENESNYRLTSYMVFGAVFIVILCVEALIKETFALYPNKYPPNIVILSYGIVWIGIFDFLYRQDVFKELNLIRPFSFLSKHSYSLFFIHYFIIYIMNTAFQAHKVLPWWAYWLTLFPVSILAQIGVNRLLGALKKR